MARSQRGSLSDPEDAESQRRPFQLNVTVVTKMQYCVEVVQVSSPARRHAHTLAASGRTELHSPAPKTMLARTGVSQTTRQALPPHPQTSAADPLDISGLSHAGVPLCPRALLELSMPIAVPRPSTATGEGPSAHHTPALAATPTSALASPLDSSLGTQPACPPVTGAGCPLQPPRVDGLGPTAPRHLRPPWVTVQR